MCISIPRKFEIRRYRYLVVARISPSATAKSKSRSWCGFWDFCFFIVCCSASWWGFWEFFFFFAALYFIVLRIGWVFGVFGVFAASNFIILRIGGIFGVFRVFAASYFIILRIGGFLGFWGFLLLHTLSF